MWAKFAYTDGINNNNTVFRMRKVIESGIKIVNTRRNLIG